MVLPWRWNLVVAWSNSWRRTTNSLPLSLTATFMAPDLASSLISLKPPFCATVRFGEREVPPACKHRSDKYPEFCIYRRMWLLWPQIRWRKWSRRCCYATDKLRPVPPILAPCRYRSCSDWRLLTILREMPADIRSAGTKLRPKSNTESASTSCHCQQL